MDNYIGNATWEAARIHGVILRAAFTMSCRCIVTLSRHDQQTPYWGRCRAQYLENQSIPEERRYVFAYTITIRNEGQIPARLLRRHWIVTDGNGKVREVRGEGVVGEQPRLLPGACFRYTSAALIETPVGTMRGEYQMLSDEGELFDAPIPVFTLVVPGSLN